MSNPTGNHDLPLRDISHRPEVHHVEAPYHLFLAASLAIGVGGGFSLGLLLPLAGAREWAWGARWQELVQAHGQLQLFGFAGLFIAGMALRMMPRFSGRQLAYGGAPRAIVGLIAGGVVVRAVAPLVEQDALHTALFAGGAVLVLAGAALFAATVVSTLIHPRSRAEATGWFFVLGAIGLLIAAAINAVLTMRALDADARVVPPAENNALLSYLLYGVILMFIGGVATRAIATLTGHQRSQIIARVAASVLALGSASHAGFGLAGALGEPSRTLNRLADASLILVAAALLMIAWASGVFHPRTNRVAAASQVQFWFVRAASAWLVASSVLLCWYAVRALVEGAQLDQFELDAVRHMTTVGVVTMMIMGMGMLVVPEFARRRLQHPREGALVWSMLAAMNLAAGLRVWPALEGIGWLSSTRYWPMAAAGALALAAVSAFASMFAQSRIQVGLLRRRSRGASPRRRVSALSESAPQHD